MGNHEEKQTKMAQMEETRAGLTKYCFRKLPSASADVRGRPRHVWAEGGRWKMGNYEETQTKLA